MNKRIRINGILYEAVSSHSYRLNEAKYNKLTSDDYDYYIDAEPLPDGKGPFISSSFPTEVILYGLKGDNLYHIGLNFAGDYDNRFWRTDVDDREEAYDTFEDIINATKRISTQRGAERVARKFGLEL